MLLRDTCAICTGSETCCYATHVPSAHDQKRVLPHKPAKSDVFNIKLSSDIYRKIFQKHCSKSDQLHNFPIQLVVCLSMTTNCTWGAWVLGVPGYLGCLGTEGESLLP